ncbi:Multidrug transporter [Sphingomonas antarctica]|uniref:efflux transporter outer membrane subunit n=1 Tax=Sphingomonas antarctica TaxID=2040274 RepID=UPI0039E987E7
MRISLTLFATASVLLGGCVPRLGPAPAINAVAPGETAATLATRPGIAVDAAWWTNFADPQLDGLIAEALAGSPDVASAAARVSQAEALVQQAGAAQAPSLSVDGVVGGNKQSYNLGIPQQFVPRGIISTGRLTATFGFNLDLWGKQRAAVRAARGDAAAARLDADQARLMLSTEVANAYAELQRDFALAATAREALALRQESSRLAGLRVSGGLDNRGSGAQAEARAPAAEADLQAAEAAIVLTRHRLAVLVGRGPDRGETIVAPAMKPYAIGIPVNAGIDLVGRRPDVVAARVRTEAAGERIKVAKADFYPNINLGAVVGLQSLGLSKLFDSGSAYGNGGPAFSLPIFDGGRIAGRYRGSRADFDLSVANYDRTLLTALGQAADAVATLDSVEAQLTEQRRSAASNGEAARIARLRYTGGLSNQLVALTAEDSLVVSRRAVADLEGRRLLAQVALIRALGGGYVSNGAR